MPDTRNFEPLSDSVRGSNWLGNTESEAKQQIRIFPNRCLVYVSIGLTNTKALEVMQSDYTSSEDLNVDQKMLQCENAAMDAGGCDRQTSAQAALNCDFMDNWHEVAPTCDTITNTGDKEDCLKQTKTKQIDLLEKAALDAGLTAEAFLVPGSLPRPGAKDSEKMQSKYTFFNINIFKLGRKGSCYRWPWPYARSPCQHRC